MESNTYTIDGKEFELRHHGVKGMKWGKRKARPQPVNTGRQRGSTTIKDKASAGLSKAKQKARKLLGGEMMKRGKAALDVLKNGDTDWMGHSTVSDDACTEAKNRGKAALERLMYSEEQIHNKKFFGEYNPFG